MNVTDKMFVQVDYESEASRRISGDLSWIIRHLYKKDGTRVDPEDDPLFGIIKSIKVGKSVRDNEDTLQNMSESEFCNAYVAPNIQEAYSD